MGFGLSFGSSTEEWNWNRLLAGDDLHDGPPSRVRRLLDLDYFEFCHFVKALSATYLRRRRHAGYVPACLSLVREKG